MAGLTCVHCGLVIDEPKRYADQPPSHKDRSEGSAIFHVNAPTMIGTFRERLRTHTQKLGLIQARTIAPGGSKHVHVYHLVVKVVHTLQLPDLLIDHAIHEYTRISKLIPRKTVMARVNVLAAIAIFNVARILGITLYRDTLLDSLGLEPREFARILIRAKAINGNIISPRKVHGETPRMINRIVSTIVACSGESAGDIARLTARALRIMAPALVGTREDTQVAAVAFVVLKQLWPNMQSLSCLATSLHCKIASIYNALIRIFKRMGIKCNTRLSEMDLIREFHTRGLRV